MWRNWGLCTGKWVESILKLVLARRPLAISFVPSWNGTRFFIQGDFSHIADGIQCQRFIEILGKYMYTQISRPIMWDCVLLPKTSSLSVVNIIISVGLIHHGLAAGQWFDPQGMLYGFLLSHWRIRYCTGRWRESTLKHVLSPPKLAVRFVHVWNRPRIFDSDRSSYSYRTAWCQKSQIL